ncbi:MAG TPA: VOC family protein [Acidimicrobiales bacterium]
MHRSRLTAALFDVPEAHFAAETAFWSSALGVTGRLDDDPDYIELDPLLGGLRFMVQRLGADTPARVHLDIETDDVAAEVARLEKLGATKVEAISTWWVMQDPAGMLFCVVRVQSPDEFEAHATTWED